MPVDITDKVFKCTAGLPVGKMVTSSSFNLDDAMSAIELMEPKMDPGFDITSKQRIFKESRERIRSASLSEPAIQRVADTLLDLMLNWVNGDLYIQSVHASMFMAERESLPNKDLEHYCDSVLVLCKGIKSLVSSTGLTDEEDFVGYMFGFDGEIKETKKIEAPKVGEECLNEREMIINDLGRLLAIKPTSLQKDSELIDKLIKRFEDLTLNESPNPVSEEESSLIDLSFDPSIHRNLLPPGPPRNVARPATSREIYSRWISVLTGIRDCAAILGSIDIDSDTLSPFELVTILTELRRHPQFKSVLLRAYLYHRLFSTFKPLPVMKSWLSAFCGGSLSSGEETEAFVSDSALVMQRIVYALFRSPSRQHRALKSTLSDLCVMQHRAWSLHSKSQQQANSQGLWMYTCAMGCSLIQLNLLLAIELDLVDFDTIELPLLLFLMETAASMKVYLLNETMGLVRTCRQINPSIARAIQMETVVSAVEQSFIDTTLKTAIKMAQLKGLAARLSGEQKERLFELRSIPFQAFPLPKTVSLDEFLARLSQEVTDTSADECMAWIDRLPQLITKVRGGIVLGSDLAVVKKTVLNNKLMLMKARKDGRLALKYHWIMPCVVLG